jgi:hypothetical protein
LDQKLCRLKKKLIPRWWFPVKQDYHDLYLKEKEEFFTEVNKMRENVEKKKNYALNIKQNFFPVKNPKKAEQMESMIARQYFGRRLHQEREVRARQNSENVKNYFHEGIVINRPKVIRVNKSMDCKKLPPMDNPNDDAITSVPGDQLRKTSLGLSTPKGITPMGGLVNKYGLKLNLGRILGIGKRKGQLGADEVYGRIFF